MIFSMFSSLFMYWVDLFDVFESFYVLGWSFRCFRVFLCTGFIFSRFSKEENVDCAIESFRLVKIKSTNKSELFLTSLVEISESCVASFIWRYLVSFKTSFFFSERATEFRISTPYLDCNNTRLILYLMMALITGSFIFWQIGSTWLYSEISRFLIMLEKKLFSTFAFVWSILVISFPSTSFIFLLETILLDDNGFTTFQNLLLSQMFLSFRVL